MAQEKPNRLVELYLLLQRQAPVVRQHVVEWGRAVREHPSLVWQTPAIRYATYAVGGIILVSVFGWFAGLLAPPPPAGARAEATTADFHVVCTNPSCGIHFAVRRPFGFDDFPVRCPKCKQETGFPARRCVSKTCNGKWVVPEKVDGVLRCPICGTPFR